MFEYSTSRTCINIQIACRIHPVKPLPCKSKSCMLTDLTDDGWNVMEELLPVLRSLKCATTALCGKSEVSSSIIYPVTATLLSKHLRASPAESAKVLQFKNAEAPKKRSRVLPKPGFVSLFQH